MQIEFKAAEFKTLGAAVALSLGGRCFCVDEAECCRLQALGVQPTTWHYHQPTDRLMSVSGD
jgi:hypothetical protein